MKNDDGDEDKTRGTRKRKSESVKKMRRKTS
jgi:hypothetical protein